MSSIQRPPREASFPPPLSGLTADCLGQYFLCAWDTYEWLFSGIDQSSAVLERHRPHPFRNTLSFYYGHTAAFTVAKLRMVGLMAEPVAEWDTAMATGVWPECAEQIADQSWPPFRVLQGYRREVRDRVMELIHGLRMPERITQQHPLWALLMAIEHEFIHFHLSLPLIRRAPLARVSPPMDWNLCGLSPRAGDDGGWHDCDGGMVAFGRSPEEDHCYGWDNEYGECSVRVPPFRMRRHPVTNGEFLDFVEDGGYRQRRWWTTPGVDTWFETLQPSHPVAWVPEDGGYRYRAPFQELPMPWHWPVEVSKHEAAAYAAWSGARLVREAEFHWVLQQECPDARTLAARLDAANIALDHCSPAPVGTLLPAHSPTGIDCLGNVALWADGEFQPLNAAQFAPHRLYPDFSQPWFRGDHSVLLGASHAALGHMTRIGVMRDFVQNHMDQLAGILLVQTPDRFHGR